MNRRLHTPASYELRVEGHLDEHGSTWFDEVFHPRGRRHNHPARAGDQAALHGLLAKVADLGITVIFVEAFDIPH